MFGVVGVYSGMLWMSAALFGVKSIRMGLCSALPGDPTV